MINFQFHEPASRDHVDIFFDDGFLQVNVNRFILEHVQLKRNGWSRLNATGEKSVNTRQDNKWNWGVKNNETFYKFVALCFPESLLKPLLPAACGFTEEDKHIRSDFLFIAWFVGEKRRPLPAFCHKVIQQIFLWIWLGATMCKLQRRSCQSCWWWSFLFFYRNYSNDSKFNAFL